MIIRVFKAGLKHIVVNIGYGQFRLDVVEAQGFKLEVGHSSRRILRQGLVDFDCNFLSGNHFTGNEMILDDLLGQVKRHCLISLAGDGSTHPGTRSVSHPMREPRQQTRTSKNNLGAESRPNILS